MAVYFVRADATEHVKIGSSATPKKRIAELQTGNAARLSLERLIPGGRRVELALHRMFADRRIGGEWFRLTVEEVARAVPSAPVLMLPEEPKRPLPLVTPDATLMTRDSFCERAARRALGGSRSADRVGVVVEAVLIAADEWVRLRREHKQEAAVFEHVHGSFFQRHAAWKTACEREKIKHCKAMVEWTAATKELGLPSESGEGVADAAE